MAFKMQLHKTDFFNETCFCSAKMLKCNKPITYLISTNRINVPLFLTHGKQQKKKKQKEQWWSCWIFCIPLYVLQNGDIEKYNSLHKIQLY